MKIGVHVDNNFRIAHRAFLRSAPLLIGVAVFLANPKHLLPGDSVSFDGSSESFSSIHSAFGREVGPDAQSLGLAGTTSTRTDSFTAWAGNPGLTMSNATHGRHVKEQMNVSAGISTSAFDRKWTPYKDNVTAITPTITGNSLPRLKGFASIRGRVPSTPFTASLGYFAWVDREVSLPRAKGDPALTSPLRFSSIRTRFLKRSAALAVATSLLDGHASIGLGLGMYTVRLEQERHLSGLSKGEAPRPYEDTSWDVPMSMSLQDKWVPRGSIGMMLKPWNFLTTTLAVGMTRGPRLRGDIKAEAPAGDPLASFTGDKGASTTLPWELEIITGISVTIGRFWFAGEFMHLIRKPGSAAISTDIFTVGSHNTGEKIPWGDIRLPYPIETGRTRFSGAAEVKLLDGVVSLRGGFSAKNASAPTYLEPVSPDENWSGLVSAGVSIQFNKLVLDLGYGYTFSKEVTMKTQAQAPAPFGGPLPIIPYTKKKTEGHIAAFTLSYSLTHLQ